MSNLPPSGFQSRSRLQARYDAISIGLTHLLEAASLGVLYYVMADPAARGGNHLTLAAIAWPAPAVATALLWRLPCRRWGLFLLAVFVSMMYVGDLDALPPRVDAQFAALNVFQITLCAWLGKRYVAPDGVLDTIARLWRFLFLLPLCAIALVAVIGASIAWAAVGTSWPVEFGGFMIGNGLAVLVIVPAMLAWPLPGTPLTTVATLDLRNAARRWPTVAGAIGATALLLLWLVPGMIDEIVSVLLALLLVCTAIYSGMKGVSLAVLATAIVSIALTLIDVGPYGDSHDANSAWLLQLNLAGIAVLSFFVATALRERERLAERLERARRFESLGLLAGGIAHDFRNILGAVGGYAEMADERIAAGQPVQNALREAISGVARGRDLVEQILLAARRGDRHRKTLDLREIATEAVTLATPLCPAGIRIALTLPQHALPVLAHRDQLVRAVLNLIRNATQAAQAQVRVTLDQLREADDDLMVGDTPNGPCARLSVRDDGTGIAQAHLAQLFDPFFSTRNGPGGSGTGLGLAIVAGVAAEHDGGIGVQAGEANHYNDEHGATFHLILPLSNTGIAVETTSAAILPDPPELQIHPIGDGRQVLLVDDDDALREQCEEWLAELGFEPLGYPDPQQALQDCDENDIALLITDLQMPGMSGDRLSAALRLRMPALPVLLCSGAPELNAVAATAQAVPLNKPFDRNTLAAAIATALERAQ
jgi:signal transduction histidine kinase/CheY-like chemotaxis protein